MLLALSIIGAFFSSNSRGYTSEDEGEYSEAVYTDSLAEAKGEVHAMSHHRVWRGYSYEDYEGSFSILTDSATLATEDRDLRLEDDWPRYNQINFLEYKRDPYTIANRYIYSFLANNSQYKVAGMYQMIDSIRADVNPSRMQLAEILVSFVQDIPYVLVHSEGCEAADSGSFSFEYHKEGKPCLPNTKYGLQGPAEFLYNLQGDCDTRTVLLYTLLRHYGYDVAVLNSEEYAHSILGINLPTQGEFVKYQGRKYYVWETTGLNWMPGNLPPIYGNIAYWKVIVASG